MRILHLATFLQGGAGRVIVDLALEQARTGHTVVVVTSRTGAPGYDNYQAYLDELSAAGITVHRIDSTFVRNASANLAVVRALADCPGDAWPDVIHTHAAVPSFIALTAAGARRRDTRIVQTMHGWGVNKTPEQAAADIAVMNLVDKVITPSLHSATLLVRLGVDPKRLVTIPYGVRPHGAAPDPRDESLLVEMVRARHRGALVVACVGTIGPRKNQALLVEAAAILKRRDATPVLIVLAGEGDTTAIQAQIAADGLEGAVRVHGYTPAARRIAAAADLLVLPSQGEGQPLAVLEAFCDDVLVAASDIAELRELVEHGTTGLVFTANDAAALADALAAAARLPAPARRAMRTRARNRVSAIHTVAQMSDAHLAVYRSLPSGPASAPAPGVFSVA